jgi:hypothetical protein
VGAYGRHLAVFALVAALAGCTPAGADPGAAPTRGGTPAVAPTPSGPLGPPPPAAYAGGACLLLDYEVIRAILGVDFNVSAAADTSGTYTCVIQDTAAAEPDLTLSITATDLSAAEFIRDVQPKGAKAVARLGRVGYEIALGGPAIEVSWLSGNNRLLVLRYTFPPDAPAATVTAMLPKLADLAHQVDATTV